VIAAAVFIALSALWLVSPLYRAFAKHRRAEPRRSASGQVATRGSPGEAKYSEVMQPATAEGGNMRFALLILLILLLVAALPTWPYSAGWGYYSSGGLGLLRSSWSYWR